MTRLLLVVALGAIVSACTPDNDVDYCRDHYLYHADHLEGLGRLSISLSEDGVLSSDLLLPETSISDAAVDALQNVGSVYRLQTSRACTSATSDVRRQGSAILASYESQCGTDNKIGQLDVVLFDNLASLEELEVVVKTPVTQKRFAISRQCDSAIFRLD